MYQFSKNSPLTYNKLQQKICEQFLSLLGVLIDSKKVYQNLITRSVLVSEWPPLAMKTDRTPVTLLFLSVNQLFFNETCGFYC